MSRAALLTALLFSLCVAPPLYAGSEDDEDDDDDAEVEPKEPLGTEPAKTPLGTEPAEPPKAPDAKDSHAEDSHAEGPDAKDAGAPQPAATAVDAAPAAAQSQPDQPLATKALPLAGKALPLAGKALPLAGEGSPPRPPLPEVESPTMPEADARLEVGGGFAWVSRPFAEGLVTSGASYDAAPGFTLRLDWQAFSWLRFHPYFVWARHDVTLEAAALVTASPTSIAREATVEPLTATTFAFGARIAPTLALSPRWRGWLAAGIGYGRMGLSDTTVVEPSGSAFALGSRDGVFVEAPIALGVAFEAIPRWLAIVAETSAAPVFGQSGAAHESVQAIDAQGAIRDVGPLGAFEASFVQSIGVALIL